MREHNTPLYVTAVVNKFETCERSTRKRYGVGTSGKDGRTGRQRENDLPCAVDRTYDRCARSLLQLHRRSRWNITPLSAGPSAYLGARPASRRTFVCFFTPRTAAVSHVCLKRVHYHALKSWKLKTIQESIHLKCLDALRTHSFYVHIFKRNYISSWASWTGSISCPSSHISSFLPPPPHFLRKKLPDIVRVV